MNYYEFTNNQTRIIATAIDNIAELESAVKTGLAICARRWSGQEPRPSSYPFITANCVLSKQMRDASILGLPPTPDLRAPGDEHIREESVFGIRLDKCFLERVVVLSKDNTNFNLSEVDIKQITTHLIQKHWEGAVQQVKKAARHKSEDFEP